MQSDSGIRKQSKSKKSGKSPAAAVPHKYPSIFATEESGDSLRSADGERERFDDI